MVTLCFTEGCFEVVVATDVAGGHQFPRHRTLVVDSKVHLSDFTQDLEKGHFQLRKYKRVFIMLGREDVISRADWLLVLEGFLKQVHHEQVETQVILTGLNDDHTTDKLISARQSLKERLCNEWTVHYSDVMDDMYDNGRIIHCKFDCHGLNRVAVAEIMSHWGFGSSCK